MAYLVNRHETATTIIRLASGLVQIGAKKYYELVDMDINQARELFNSEELKLYVAETLEELEIVLGSLGTTAEESNVNSQVTEPVAEPVVEPVVEETVVAGVSLEVAEGTAELTDEEKTTLAEEATEFESGEDLDKAIEEGSVETSTVEPVITEEDPITAKINAANAKVIALLEAKDLEGIRELATSLEIKFPGNTGIDTLANKILKELESLKA
jgi:hypothetical protein